MSRVTEPIIIEPHTENRQANPQEGNFLLYDSDFPLETAARYSVVEGNPLRFPHFPVGEVAAWVFGKNPQWLRDRIKGKLALQGKPLEFRQFKGRGPTHQERRLTLADCERLAWALYESNKIDGLRLQRASEILVAIAQLHVKDQENN